MRRTALPALAALLCTAPAAWGYVEAPYSLGQMVNESTTITLMEIKSINKEKNLIIYKKVQDLKGKHPTDEIKHNIGQRGFAPREWQNIMNWAEVGKKAVFFHNGSASETCIGTYWYQCYAEGEWWGLSHAEPFLLRTFYGEADKLVTALTEMLQNKDVIVTCLQDGSKEQLHQRKGKLQRLKASLKRGNYDVKRDFVSFGGEGEEIVEFRTVALLPEGSVWQFLPAADPKAAGERWRAADFNDNGWRAGKAPIGYGEPEIANRKGTTITEQGQAFVFRKEFNIPAEVLAEKGVLLRLCVASDNCAVVYLNGELLDQDEGDHEPVYWNRDVEFEAKKFKAGRNVIAVMVNNGAGSSDLFLDLEISAQIPVAKPPPKK